MIAAQVELPRSRRVAWVGEYAFAIPSEDALEAIARWAPDGIVELGAGNGYWAHLLSERGVSIVAVEPKLRGRRKIWHSMVKGDHRSLARYPNRTLFICWPTQGDSWAERALRTYRGTAFIYCGLPREGAEEGATCATPGFFDLLDREWQIEERVEIPNFERQNDALTLYARRGSLNNFPMR